MEEPRGAAGSAGSPRPSCPSPMEPPASDQTTLERMPIAPSSSATPWILGRPSAGALSSVTVPVRLDTLAYLLNSALLRAYSAVPQTPLSCGHGASAMGHGGPPPRAPGCGCQPHYCCGPQPACANSQPAREGCCGSGAVGQSSAGCSQEMHGGRDDWQDSSVRRDQRGSPLLSGWGENRRAREQKDFFRPGGWQRPWGKADSAPHKAGQWGPGRAQGSDYAARKRNQDGCLWDAPGTKRWSSGGVKRWGSGAGKTEAAKAAREDWEANYGGSTTRGSVLGNAWSSQPNLPASQEGEDWEKEYEESPKSAPGVPPLPQVALKVQPASRQERTTPRPASKDGSFSSYLHKLIADLPGGSSQERQPPGGAAGCGTRPPGGGGGGPSGQGSAKLGDFMARRVDLPRAATENEDRA
ncbi:uncharacterized protein C19orf84 homolog [Mauremys mutica]|uniref:uncharacterized protein C19orf84 homolog n=1 Tax=Mauremys mutica TaxID=74926 RepID=UPI001D16DA86|nr:uncharacterized protein C19orf84 homolog [Mauremys mutica]